MTTYDIISLFIQALIAVGTIGAVIISLYYSHKSEKIERELQIHSQFTERFNVEKPYVCLMVTIENTGNVPIVLDQIGRTDGKNKNVIYVDDMNKYLVNDRGLILIKPNEACIIEYRKVFDDQISAVSVDNWRESSDYKFLNNAVFYAKDTLGNFYPVELYKKLRNRIP